MGWNQAFSLQLSISPTLYYCLSSHSQCIGQVQCFLAVIMSQIQSTYSKLTNASAKLSHRRIFPQPQPAPSQGNDLHRIAAKIRELEDDVRAILSENTQIQQENRQLIGVLEELQFVVGQQQGRMEELAACLRRDSEAGECIAQYEQDLGTVAHQIGTLNDLIRGKNEQYEQLRGQRQEEIYQNMRLKEQSNHLLYSHNSLLQNLAQLVEEPQAHDSHSHSHDSLTFDEDIEQKAHLAFEHCERLAARIQLLRQTVEQGRRESNGRANVEKQRRMRLEYEVRLLRERKGDQAKREGYFRGFYDEERIQAVIDDMLQKEDSLRTQIAHLEESSRQAQQQWEEELEDRRRQGLRDRMQREEEARLVQLEIDALQGELREGSLQLSQVVQRLEVVETDGIQMNQLQESSDSDLWQRIRATEEENMALQRQFEQLSGEVQLLQRELAI